MLVRTVPELSTTGAVRFSMEPSAGLPMTSPFFREDRQTVRLPHNVLLLHGSATAIIAHDPAGGRKQTLRLHGVKTSGTISILLNPVQGFHGPAGLDTATATGLSQVSASLVFHYAERRTFFFRIRGRTVTEMFMSGLFFAMLSAKFRAAERV